MDPRDDYNEEMMNIINAGGQCGPIQNQPDPEIEDDGSQYLLFEEDLQAMEENPVQENAGEVIYILC
jgi:hypothetical protein